MTADPGTDPDHQHVLPAPGRRRVPDSGEVYAPPGRCSGLGSTRSPVPPANRPAVYLLELDGIGSSGCVRKMGSLGIWEADLRYEVSKISSLPHTVVYLEAGYSDANGPRYTARVLNAAGVGTIRGFWTNDTHLNWTISEIKWGDKVSRLTHNAHFVINTAQNGNGPKKNPHPVTQGNEDLCNPPGRGLGPRPTTDTGFASCRRVPLELAARQQQRTVQRRHFLWHVLDRARDRARRPRERPPRPELPEPAVLSRGEGFRGALRAPVGVAVGVGLCGLPALNGFDSEPAGAPRPRLSRVLGSVFGSERA